MCVHRELAADHLFDRHGRDAAGRCRPSPCSREWPSTTVGPSPLKVALAGPSVPPSARGDSVSHQRARSSRSSRRAPGRAAKAVLQNGKFRALGQWRSIRLSMLKQLAALRRGTTAFRMRGFRIWMDFTREVHHFKKVVKSVVDEWTGKGVRKAWHAAPAMGCGCSAKIAFHRRIQPSLRHRHFAARGVDTRWLCGTATRKLLGQLIPILQSAARAEQRIQVHSA